MSPFRRSLVSCGVLLALAACGTPPPNLRLPTNLPVNGGFEQGFDAWGTGYIEDSVRKYHAPEEGMLPYWVSPSAQATNSRLYLSRRGSSPMPPEDTLSGNGAARIEHVQEKKAQHYGTLAQRVAVTPKTDYELEVWTRYVGKQADWFVTAVREWEPHVNLPGEGKWTVTRLRFTTADSQKEAEIRFVIEAPGTYWIDDVALYVLSR